MSGRISLSSRDARSLVRYCDRMLNLGEVPTEDERQARERLRSALAPRKKTERQRSSARVKRDHKAEKNAETAALREEVSERAGGNCENPSCGVLFRAFNPAEMDHFFSRGREPQTVATCWMLCRACHRNKTNSEGSAARWLQEFIRHCDWHGYVAESEKARARLEGIVAVRAASVSRAREGRDG